ncbi:hypothetical protein A3D78_04530 [Candidatus Gottesmanbacteria bacterium RIFCSPHIGHO2_02_FULL_39_14]|uniref:5'-3' exonuclease domain-containing protein n=3 Tax=Candidatus Gottesmaniibacteriota TaxID=1752720 RepID=A0A1F6A330_9BACT|nr:MAG: hypothetical protein A2153_01460 [Candidatus Gottesmanbacteria bacterium RBG_16_38_7b]OGG19113.1 MAG: hypothetical protein A3D78_04530 [Candidatus Gottesmanbacteria bacterium RIFCSPHIGHO2_02_FULL_39_14]OGG30867.1 MAG: hypothetical protein A3I51_01565 [Candidatus Gottesmanbacteria bacterium RIFCSPLOWO2_02_FULL_38_8]
MLRLVLIDGHAILYRAYHALPPLTTSKGVPSGAVYGFISILLKTINDLKPTNLAVAFDRREPTFRKKLFADYQVQRPKMEENLVSQVDLMHSLIKTMGIAVYELAGFEADDVIGTLAEQVVKGEKSEVIVVTGDRDLLQLVTERIRIYMPVKGISEAKLFGKNEVVEKYGVLPSQVVDYKALIGDQSDNYPGVAGIGPKTAENLIKKYGSLEGIYKNIDFIEPKLKEKLTRDKEKAYLSYKLAEIVKNAPVNLDLASTKLISLDRPDVRAVFEELGFRSLITRLSGKSNKPASVQNKSGLRRGEEKKAAEKQKKAEQTSLF